MLQYRYPLRHLSTAELPFCDLGSHLAKVEGQSISCVHECNSSRRAVLLHASATADCFVHGLQCKAIKGSLISLMIWNKTATGACQPDVPGHRPADADGAAARQKPARAATEQCASGHQQPAQSVVCNVRTPRPICCIQVRSYVGNDSLALSPRALVHDLVCWP